MNFDDLPQFTNGVARAAIPPSGGATTGTFRYNYAVRAARFPGRLNTIFNSDDSYSSNDMGRLVSESKGWSAQLDWDIAGDFRLTSISAERTRCRSPNPKVLRITPRRTGTGTSAAR